MGGGIFESAATPGSKVDVYLRLRVQESKVVRIGFGLNVSEAAKADQDLAVKLAAILRDQVGGGQSFRATKSR